MSSSAKPSEPTRTRIRTVAERLFAREGIDRVTLRQIGRSARQRNVAAVQYHFGSKENLLDEILNRHISAIDAQRREMLDEQEAAGETHDIGSLLRVLVEPLAERLDDPSGRAYLQIQAQRIIDASSMLPATRVLAARIRRALSIEKDDPMRDRFVVLLLFHALADRAREEESGGQNLPGRGEFVATLTRAIHGLYRELSTPEPATRAAAGE